MSSLSLIIRCRAIPGLVVSSQRYIQALMESHGSQTSKQRMVYREDHEEDSRHTNGTGRPPKKIRRATIDDVRRENVRNGHNGSRIIIIICL
ncbi:hypothetical protein EVAR_99675_1 [Eumeta japonica]|uniref:Uncharacterized protein n=1 Tax=Eumeta variegata TaxID=151549 RepID=A0A4C2A0P0_EUMVA|nr:hypothetical protein EVAR_99675_1 [Eumeta japonica]